MRSWNQLPWVLLWFYLVPVSPATAGMPAPLPTDPERFFRLNETPLMRFQAISFFLLGLLLSAAAIQWLWNYLRRDFSRLPRLTYGKAVAGVLLWGLLFILVLAMISGARELMTPGAWKKRGFTYKLAADSGQPPGESPAQLRERQLEHLRTALWNFAAAHHGRFPSRPEVKVIPRKMWVIPGAAGMRFLYVPGQSVQGAPALLVYEPELAPHARLVLQTDGDITRMESKEIDHLRKAEARP
jgi:hypothetical protein